MTGRLSAREVTGIRYTGHFRMSAKEATGIGFAVYFRMYHLLLRAISIKYDTRRRIFFLGRESPSTISLRKGDVF